MLLQVYKFLLKKAYLAQFLSNRENEKNDNIMNAGITIDNKKDTSPIITFEPSKITRKSHFLLVGMQTIYELPSILLGLCHHFPEVPCGKSESLVQDMPSLHPETLVVESSRERLCNE